MKKEPKKVNGLSWGEWHLKLKLLLLEKGYPIWLLVSNPGKQVGFMEFWATGKTPEEISELLESCNFALGQQHHAVDPALQKKAAKMVMQIQDKPDMTLTELAEKMGQMGLDFEIKLEPKDQ